MSRLHLTPLAVVVAAALFHPSPGSAQPANTAAPASTAAPATSAVPSSSPAATTSGAPVSASEEAGRTFQQGREAFKADQFDRALELFQQSYSLEPTPGVLLNIALTEEKLGKPASALLHFERAAELFKSDDDRLPIARDGVARTTLRAPRLEIDRAAGAPPTLAVSIDGQALAANLVGVEQPIDPGKHVITTRVFGFDERRYEVTLGEGQRVKIAVEPGKRVLMATTTPAAAAGSNDPARVAVFALGGAGIAALGVGAVTGILAIGTQGDKNARKAQLAPGVACAADPTCARLDGEGLMLGNASTGSLVAGGVALAAGTVIFFVTGRSAFSFGAAASTDGASISATGRF